MAEAPVTDGTPRDITIKDSIFSIDCHPTVDLIAIGLINGTATVYSYTTMETLQTMKHHKQSCRALKFSSDGKSLFTGSKDTRLCEVDVNSGKLLHNFRNSDKSPLYSMHVVNANTLATGDDAGVIKVWDARILSPAFTINVHSDFISDITSDDKNKTLLAVSGDGSLSAIDLRHQKHLEKSDTFESELLSAAIVKNGSKVICGDGDGTICIFNWGLWGDITDRFPAHSQSIDSILKISEDLVCTSCMDGTVRAVQVLPNQTILEVGSHELPVDYLGITHDQEYIASSSQDCVKFWPVDDVIQARIKSDPLLRGGDESSDCEDNGNTDAARGVRKKRKKKKNVCSKKTKLDFFADL